MKSWFVAILALLFLATGASAASEKGRFDVYVQGQKSGDLRFQGRDKAAGYTAQIRLKIKGALAAQFDGKVQGDIQDGAYLPVKYSEKSNLYGAYAVNMGLRDDGVTVKHRGDADTAWMPAEDASGLADPVTVLWQLLQARTPDKLCQMDTSLFDGARKMQLKTREPKPRGGAVTCVGRLTRSAGFTEAQLETGTSVAFEIEYAPSQNGLYRANRIDLNLPTGRVILVRR